VKKILIVDQGPFNMDEFLREGAEEFILENGRYPRKAVHINRWGWLEPGEKIWAKRTIEGEWNIERVKGWTWDSTN